MEIIKSIYEIIKFMIILAIETAEQIIKFLIEFIKN